MRVYLLLGALAVLGIVSGFKLPVSLFPNSSKPLIVAEIPYGSFTSEEFLNSFGKDLEIQLRKITAEKIRVEKIKSSYGRNSVSYQVQFKWGVAANAAEKEVRYIVNSFASRLPPDSRDNIRVDIDNENSGFFALSFYSETRSLNDLYDYLEPILTPRISKVADAQEPGLWNPSGQEIRIQLIPETMASLQLFPKDIESALAPVLSSRTGGSVTVGTNKLNISLPRQVTTMEDLRSILVSVQSGKTVHLGDISRIDLGAKTTDTRSFKTSGAPSLILFATPKPGGNVKKMSEDLFQIVKDLMPSLPKDIKYRVLVDPSEFIRSAVNNVFREVGMAALLAVAVLFLFIGSFRNVVTAAIEIPMSMILAFILMRFSGMNLNLISLGGLALSAGMNVDASVVVMENIFRHFEMDKGPHDFPDCVRIVVKAVKEVQFAILASTVSSLVVFLPLTFTSDLSYAILGDLALAVVFSHGFSALVALLLVPTVRLHLMSRGGATISHSPIESTLKKLERGYGKLLNAFIQRPMWKWGTFGGLTLLLIALTAFVLPRLPKEIVGVPDTDWMTLNIHAEGNILVRQMEVEAEEIERDLLTTFRKDFAYTFSMVRNPNNATIMGRLVDKGKMRDIWKAMEKKFANTPLLKFFVGPWNPSELPIPDPPHLQIAVRGGNPIERTRTAHDLMDLIQEKKLFPRVWTEPNAESDKAIFLEPHVEQLAAINKDYKGRFTESDLADLVRVASTGRRVGYLPDKNRRIEIVMNYPPMSVSSIEDIGALAVGVGPKIVPLKALAEITLKDGTPTLYREDEQDMILVEARLNRGDEAKAEAAVAQTKLAVAEWENAQTQSAGKRNETPVVIHPTLTWEDPAKDLTDAIQQLSFAVGFSILLIFLTLILQFSTVVEPLLVLVSVPLGFLGVLLSLFIFRSTLSLNSILGVILLNGIAVANSIILVDFVKRLVAEGRAPRAAAIEAAQKRLRPILITSATTILGMLPVAIGLGEGGRILQPLGIAVSGGLWVSTTLTLLLVPALHVAYLEWKAKPKTSPVSFSTFSLAKFFRRNLETRGQA